MQVPDPYWDGSSMRHLKLTGGQNEDVDHTRAALAMCENIDDNVGRLLAALRGAEARPTTPSSCTSATTARTAGAGTAG